jgi:hypothetical protein
MGVVRFKPLPLEWNSGHPARIKWLYRLNYASTFMVLAYFPYYKEK